MPPSAWQNCRVCCSRRIRKIDGSTSTFSAGTDHEKVTPSTPTSRQLKLSYHLRPLLTRILPRDATDRPKSCFPLVSCGRGGMGRYLSPMSDETSRPVRPGELHLSPAPQFWPDQSPSLNTPDKPHGLRDGGTDASPAEPGVGKTLRLRWDWIYSWGPVLAVLHGMNCTIAHRPLSIFPVRLGQLIRG